MIENKKPTKPNTTTPNTKTNATTPTKTLSKLENLAYLYDLKQNFSSFVKASWPIFETNNPLIWNWHHDAICQHIQATLDGKIQRLIIALPPRHTKSSIVNVALIPWVWIHDPSARFLTASYAMSLSLRDAQRSRDLIDSQWYQQLFGNTYQWLGDQNQKTRYETNHHGYRISTSVEGAATGEGADMIIVDDPHNIQESTSDTMRQATLSWWDRVMSSRLNDQLTGKMIIIGQRVHPNDLIGHLLDTNEWEYLCLPAEFEPEHKTITSINWQDPRQTQGEPLWEQKFPTHILEYLKKILGLEYYAQYQQRPSSEEGAILKQSYFLTYTVDGKYYVLYTPDGEQRIPIAACRTVLSTDFAVSKNQANDYTCFLVWHVTPTHQYLLIEIIHDRMEGPEAEDLLWAIASASPRLWVVLVEDVNYQKAIIQRLKRGHIIPPHLRYNQDSSEPSTNVLGQQMRRGLPVLAYKPQVDKISRMQSLVIYFVNHLFYFSPGVAGLTEYKKEMTTFPKSPHDDFVDASTILLKLFEMAEPGMDRLAMNEIERQAAIDELALDNKELADFLREDSEDYDMLAEDRPSLDELTFR